MNYRLIDMQVHGDRRGKLISLEGMKNVPFEIKRIYSSCSPCMPLMIFLSHTCGRRTAPCSYRGPCSTA